jgi:hypothetical protein
LVRTASGGVKPATEESVYPLHVRVFLVLVAKNTLPLFVSFRARSLRII